MRVNITVKINVLQMHNIHKLRNINFGDRSLPFFIILTPAYPSLLFSLSFFPPLPLNPAKLAYRTFFLSISAKIEAGNPPFWRNLGKNWNYEHSYLLCRKYAAVCRKITTFCSRPFYPTTPLDRWDCHPETRSQLPSQWLPQLKK